MGKYDWQDELRGSSIYKTGVEDFMKHVKEKFGQGARVCCPCKRCLNAFLQEQHDVKAHLLVDGIEKFYRPWSCHGEEPNFVFPMDLGDRTYAKKIHGDMYDDIDDGASVDDDDIDDILHDLDYENDGLGTNKISCEWLESLVNDSKDYLFPGENKYTKFSFLVKLLHLKVYGKFSRKTLDGILWLLRDAIPALKVLPEKSYGAYKYLQEMGMRQQKIDACKNNCMLYWKGTENDTTCSKCGTPRYKVTNGIGKPMPHKILRYFPLKPRLQRLFLSSKIAPHMVWHKNTKPTEEGWMSHPRDSKTWKKFNNDYPQFAKDGRNVYLALSSDGFNPFGTMSQSYSMWPVILVTYNLPPWMCMKPEFYMMSLLIPGPQAPGMAIDVFLQPLVNELNDLWENGLDTYDAATKTTFKMHAVLLWTINDFPAYGILSGWQTKGYFACSICRDKTPSVKLRSKIGYIGCRCFLPLHHPLRASKKFDGSTEKRSPPVELTPEQLLQQVESLSNRGIHNVSSKKRYRDEDKHNWKKKSIFFQLPYWHTLALRHNLDVMHVEKNILENVLWTILNVVGKSKDTLKARLDLEDMNIRKELHLQKHPNGGYDVPQACYTMSTSERKKFCDFLKGVKLPEGYASNIGRCVNTLEGKISGLKSHDCHVLLQKLLPVGIRSLLPKAVAEAISEIGYVFSKLCQSKVSIDEMEKMQNEVVLVLCKMEMIFPPAFFDVMVHLLVHLPYEVLLAGPVVYRWMYPIERFLCSIKQFVRNRAQPEGSIAQAYIVHECLTWCSMHIDDMETKFNRPERNFNENEIDSLYTFSHKVRVTSEADFYKSLPEVQRKNAIWFILSNEAKVQPYMDEHRKILEQSSSLDIDTLQKETFSQWFKVKMCHVRNIEGNNKTDLIESLYALASGPYPSIKSYSSCIVNGVRYHTESRDYGRKHQNSSIMVIGSDADGVEREFYGVIQDILQFDYILEKKVYIFQCKWWDLGSRKNVKIDGHLKCIKVQKTWYDDDPFVLATQVRQVYYLDDMKNGPMWRVVQKHVHRHLFDVPTRLCNVQGVTDADTHSIEEENIGFDTEDIELSIPLDVNFIHDEVKSLQRTEMYPTHVEATVVTHLLNIKDNAYIEVDGDDDYDDTLSEYDD